VENSPTLAYLGLGTNLGDRRAYLTGAREALSVLPQTTLAGCSHLYRSEAVGGPEGQPDYLNAVLALSTGLTPQTLLKNCLEIEQRSGRRRDERWGPRTLDIDLLLYGRRVIESPELTLPHPRLHLRRFVLQPLLELAPGLHHPLLERPLVQLLDVCERQPLCCLGEW